MSSPELGGDGRRRGEVCQLLADAGEEEPREAFAVDGRDAGRPDPADEPIADDAQVPPQPVPGKPARDRARTAHRIGVEGTKPPRSATATTTPVFHRELVVIKFSYSRHAGDPAVPLQVPRHQGVPRRHPAAPREA